MEIRTLTSGGKSRSLGITDEVVQCILAEETNLDNVLACIFSVNEVAFMKACDTP